MKIYLIRHGQTTGDIEDRFGGDYDDHLTELGWSQAEELAEKLKALGIERIYHSPRIRAAETASIVNEVTDIPIEQIGNLRERNAYGILTGKLKSEAKVKYPELLEKLKDHKAAIEGAEAYADFKKRVLDVFAKITGSNLDTLAIITHGGVISCFLRELVGRERTRLADCAIIELEYENGKYKIIKSEGLELK